MPLESKLICTQENLVLLVFEGHAVGAEFALSLAGNKGLKHEEVFKFKSSVHISFESAVLLDLVLQRLDSIA